MVLDALKSINRYDLIGNSERCLVSADSRKHKRATKNLAKGKPKSRIPGSVKDSKRFSNNGGERKGKWQRIDKKPKRKR